jgi:hypothetical protein
VTPGPFSRIQIVADSLTASALRIGVSGRCVFMSLRPLGEVEPSLGYFYEDSLVPLVSFFRCHQHALRGEVAIPPHFVHGRTH